MQLPASRLHVALPSSRPCRVSVITPQTEHGCSSDRDRSAFSNFSASSKWTPRESSIDAPPHFRVLPHHAQYGVFWSRPQHFSRLDDIGGAGGSSGGSSLGSTIWSLLWKHRHLWVHLRHHTRTSGITMSFLSLGRATRYRRSRFGAMGKSGRTKVGRNQRNFALTRPSP